MFEPDDLSLEPNSSQGTSRFWAVGLGWAGMLLAIGISIYAMRPAFGGAWEREPWLGRNGARYSLVARNYQRIGWWETGLAPVINAGDPDRFPRQYYMHHPPLMPITLGLVFGWFGESEDVARGMIAGFTLVSLLALFGLITGVYGWVTGGATVTLFALFPITGIYGAHVDVQGPQVLALVLISLFCLQRYERTRRRKWWGLCLLVYGLALLSDWPAYYLGALLPVFGSHRLRKILGRKVWAFALLGLCVFVLTRIQSQWTGADKGGFGNSLEVRTFAFYRGLADLTPQFQGAVSRWIGEVGDLYPWPFLLLSGLGILLNGRRDRIGWVWPILLMGVLHMLLFPGGALVHDYWTFAMQPGLAIFAALGLLSIVSGINRLSGRISTFTVPLAVVLLFLGSFLLMRESLDRRIGSNGPRDQRHSLLGAAVQSATQFSDLVLTNAPYNPHDGQSLTFPQFSYYVDRRVIGGFDQVAEWDDFEGVGSANAFLWVPPNLFPGQMDSAGSDALRKRLEEKNPAVSLGGGIQLYRLDG